MPAYIKMYYAFAIYLLLWAVGISIVFTYAIIVDGGSSVSDILFMVTAYIVFVLALLKSLVSLKACKRYKQQAQLTIAERDVFIAAYLFIICFAVGTLLIGLDEIRNDFILYYEKSRPIITSVMFDTSLLLAAMAGIYFAITDFILLKAIRKKHEDSLLGFDVEKD